MYEANHGLQAEEQTFLTVLFGYLIVAHVLGASLNRRQVFVFNAIYLVIAGGLLYNMYDYWSSLNNWLVQAQVAEFGRVVGDVALRGRMTVLACALTVVGSLYFMWTVRRSKSPATADTAMDS